jgi:uncharacterized protein (DUF433 family)
VIFRSLLPSVLVSFCTFFSPSAAGGAGEGLGLSRLHRYPQPSILLSSQVRTVAMNALLERISIDPNVCFGKPCIRGTRIWVSLILDFMAAGETQERILEEYPQLTRDDILAALAYGAEMSRGRFVDLPGQSAA